MDREYTLFEREIMKTQDPDNFLYRVMRHNKPTIQESVIAQLLENIQLQYIPQWILPFKDSHFVFDFLIEPNLVVECTLTERKAYKVPSWGRERALILDRKFKTLKSIEFESYSLILLEATQYPADKLKPLIRNLEYTDEIVTSIDSFEGFLHEWKTDRVYPIGERELDTISEVNVWDNNPQSTLERFI